MSATKQTKISKGQITLPKSLREQYKLRDGETILLTPLENGRVWMLRALSSLGGDKKC